MTEMTGAVIVALQVLTSIGVIGGAVAVGRSAEKLRALEESGKATGPRLDRLATQMTEQGAHLAAIKDEAAKMADYLTVQNGRIRLAEVDVAAIKANCAAIHTGHTVHEK